MWGFGRKEASGIKTVLKDTKEIVSNLNSIFETVATLIEKPKSLEELLQLYSVATTKIIKSAKEEENLSFVGGTFKIELVETHIQLSMEAYFKSANEQWIKKENSSMIKPAQVTEDAFLEIKKDKALVYNLEDPK